MLKINKQSDYGMLMISYLKDKKDFVSVSELTSSMKLPKRFLARIASIMARHKVVESREGKIGGYKLTNKARTMSLYDYLKIFEGDMAIVKCQLDCYNCPQDKICQHKDFFKNFLSPIFLKELKKQKLLQIFH